jgi:hypothetical protein
MLAQSKKTAKTNPFESADTLAVASPARPAVEGTNVLKFTRRGGPRRALLEHDPNNDVHPPPNPRRFVAKPARGGGQCVALCPRHGAASQSSTRNRALHGAKLSPDASRGSIFAPGGVGGGRREAATPWPSPEGRGDMYEHKSVRKGLDCLCVVS